MGYATIVSGGDDGRYVIAMDYGEATRTAILGALSVHAANLAVRVSEASAKVLEAEALEDAQAARYDAAVTAFIDQHSSPVPGAPRPDDTAVRFELQRLRVLQTQNQPLRINLTALKFERAQALRRIAYWTTFVATETRSAWCADYTEDAEAGQTVATLDIPGDDNLIVLAPACRGWTPSDGVLSARELMSPEQVFFNAAIFPGWQIDKPTYRWGTVTAVDADANTVDVSLAPAVSSAQRLDINRETSLAAVPADYMDTGSVVFEVDDRVVVQFQGQSWESPRVLGFVDNPRPVGIWEAMGLVVQSSPDTTYVHLRLRSGAVPTISTIIAAATGSSTTASYRVDRGAWQSLDRNVLSSTTAEYLFSGEATGTGFNLLSVSSAFAFGQQLVFSVNEEMGISAGAIVEARLFLGSDLIFNAAMVNLPGGTGPVSIVGRLLNETLSGSPSGQLTMERLAYSLFQTSGT